MFYQGQTFVAISQEWLVRLMLNEKEVHRLDTGCTMWTFDLTHDLDLGCFKVKLWNSCISGIVGLTDMKWKGSELIGYLADYITLPYDHAHDIDLVISRSEFERAFPQEWDGRLTLNKKYMSHPFRTMVLTSVIVVGWADVPDTDRCEFRRRRAVDISSLYGCNSSWWPKW